MIKKILMMLVLSIGLTSAANAQSYSLDEMVDVMGKMCPMAVSEGMSIDKVSRVGRDVVIDFTMDVAPSIIDLMRGQEDTMKKEMINSFTSNPDMTEFIRLIKKERANLVIRMGSNEGGKPIIIVCKPSDF